MDKNFLLRWFLLILIFTTFYGSALAQVETYPIDQPVYSFFKRLNVKGILTDFSDIILPLSKQELLKNLQEIELKKSLLSETERMFLEKIKNKWGISNDTSGSDNLFDILLGNNEKHLYSFKDSLFLFYVEPVVELNFIYSGLRNNNSNNIILGGKLHGSYNNWFGFAIRGTNGIVSGDRKTACLDRRVSQNFSFNETKLNYFDETLGSLRFSSDHVSLNLGRERLLWGTGYVNKMILSNNSQPFDFVKFRIFYKDLSYNFLHGWLVQEPYTLNLDSTEFKIKPSKYVAISRLEYKPGNNIALGIEQMVIYANRPMELSYLNPFLFWESAQRSLNDLDNSFLSFSSRFSLVNGMEINASIIWDDINFIIFKPKQWNRSTNRYAWQAGIYFSNPLIWEDLSLILEYVQVRPYTFSHIGYGESLAYTNNKHKLGINIEPNSALFSTILIYDVNEKLNIKLKYEYYLHGRNIVDSTGNIIKNVGGDIFNYYRLNDDLVAPFLYGDLEKRNSWLLNLTYEIFYGIFINASYYFVKNTFLNREEQYLWLGGAVNFE